MESIRSYVYYSLGFSHSKYSCGIDIWQRMSNDGSVCLQIVHNKYKPGIELVFVKNINCSAAARPFSGMNDAENDALFKKTLVDLLHKENSFINCRTNFYAYYQYSHTNDAIEYHVMLSDEASSSRIARVVRASFTEFQRFVARAIGSAMRRTR